MKRFFENVDDYFASVMRGDSIDVTSGYMDGDHVSWLMETFETDKLDLVMLAFEFSQRVRTNAEAQNVAAYVDRLFKSTLLFNIEQGADQVPEQELDIMQVEL